MAGKIVVSTLNNDTGVLATQNGMTGIAKAWVAFNGVPATPTIYSSFNVSSVTKSYAGGYTVNITNTFGNTNYCAVVQFQPTVTNAGSDNFVNISVSTATTIAMIHFEAGVNRDSNYATLAVFATP